MKKVFVLMISIIALVLLFNANGVLADSTAKSWQFSSAADYTISNSSKLKFGDGSVKIIPIGFQAAGYKTWHDNHFAPAVGGSYAGGLAVDHSGNFYLGGSTTSTLGSATEAFIVKLDSNFNEVWYKRYYATNTNDVLSGIDGLQIASDGNIIAAGFYLNNPVPTNSYLRLMKVNSLNGDVIWQTDQARGNTWASTWDDGAGPVQDSSGNIFFAHSKGPAENGGGDPIEILKYDSGGNLLWNRTVSAHAPADTYPFYEDNWQAAVDSEGSFYLSSTIASGLGAVNGGLNFGLTAYDTNGNFKWRLIKDMFDRWDAPRGLAIDSNDNLYQNGNVNLGCGLRKIAKDGTVIVDNQILTPEPGFTYCWNSRMDYFDHLKLVAVDNTPTNGIWTAKYYNDFSALGHINHQISERATDEYGPTLSPVNDRYNNAYTSISYFLDSRYASSFSVAVIKDVSIYPNTTPASGTPLYLVNKTGEPYTRLDSFSATYGDMDQNDARFQVSNNGSEFYWWNGSTWTRTVGYESNMAEEINAHITAFSDQFGAGTFYFKTFMTTDGSKEVDLASVTILHDLPANLIATLPVTGATGLRQNLIGFIGNVLHQSPFGWLKSVL